MCLVSVILPNYNHAQFLKQRIESILNQTFQDFEMIILDDYSTDNSLDIIKEYSHSPKISQTVFNAINSGSTFLQWEKGFSLAKGKYIWIAESDDYADLSFLEKLVSVLENNRASNIAFSESHIVDDKGSKLMEDWDRNKEADGSVNIFDGNTFLENKMLFRNSIYNASMVVFRKSALSKIDVNYLNFKYSGDWLFWSSICLQGGVIRYCEKLNFYRQHSAKVTPRAKSEGIVFQEDKYVIKYLIENLHLTAIQKNVVIGRLIKRIETSKDYKSKEIKRQVLNEVQKYFNCNTFPAIIYTLDKIFNFSSLNINKNKNS